MKLILLFLLTNFCISLFGQGLILDSKEYANSKHWEPKEGQGFSTSDLPLKISYRQYAPPIQNQGQLATCVGWGVAYAQLSTQQNLLMDVTEGSQKFFRSMDPYFIYGNIRNFGDLWCQKGTRISDAMQVLIEKGTKPWVWDPWLTCNSKITFSEFTNALASNYVVSDYYAVPNDDLVLNVKQALYFELIVSVGVNLTESFQAGSAAKNGLWSPSSSEKLIGGHAMCVVGYDDSKYGGAFEVMNSWGADYGENGFIWIKYSDFKKYVSEAYVINAGDYKKGNCSMGDCYNSYSRYKYKDGSVYEGLIVDGYPDIYGAYVYSNGNFYVGGMNKGRKNGAGIFYDVAQKKYFNVNFNNDVYVSWSVKQGFSSTEESEKMLKLMEILNTLNPATVVSAETEEQDEYFEKMEIPLEPLSIPKN